MENRTEEFFFKKRDDESFWKSYIIHTAIIKKNQIKWEITLLLLILKLFKATPGYDVMISSTN